MGKAGDPDAVVDSHGKVFGVNKLRLVDISTFPILPPGHTQANVCKKTHRPYHHTLERSQDFG